MSGPFTFPTRTGLALKVLDEFGNSPIKRVAWPLPRGEKLGAWVDTAPVEPQICRSGLHGVSAAELEHWLSYYRFRLFAMQLDLYRPVVSGHGKVAAQRARLLFEIQLPWHGAGHRPWRSDLYDGSDRSFWQVRARGVRIGGRTFYSADTRFFDEMLGLQAYYDLALKLKEVR